MSAHIWYTDTKFIALPGGDSRGSNCGGNVAKILLVEDDAILVEMYQAKFELEGHEIQIATNGEECLNVLNEFTPELILLDILMPKLNGFHVLKEIKKRPTLRQIPVILLTNLGEQEVDMNRELAQALGVNDYLIKSHHTPDEVVERAVRALGEGRATAPRDQA